MQTRLVLSLLIALSSARAFAISRGDHVLSSQLGVVSLVSMDTQGGLNQDCSAVFYTPTIVLTAKHCIDAGARLVLTKIDQTKLAPMVVVDEANIVTSKTLDLAMVRLPAGVSERSSQIAVGGPVIPQVFQIYGFGSQLPMGSGYDPTPNPGDAVETTALVPLAKVTPTELVFRLHQTEMYASFGDSGGPVFDENGHLAGVLTSVELVDDEDQWGNQWIENRAVWLGSQDAKDFIAKAQVYFTTTDNSLLK